MDLLHLFFSDLSFFSWEEEGREEGRIAAIHLNAKCLSLSLEDKEKEEEEEKESPSLRPSFRPFSPPPSFFPSWLSG